MSATSIQWTDKVWNPTRGCSRVSAGCDNCYAMRQARRFDFPGGAYEGLTRVGSRGVDWSGKVRLVLEALDEPLRWRKPQRVFVNSMSDLFHETLRGADIGRVFGVMATSPQHTFQVLTKRPQRMLDLLHPDVIGPLKGEACQAVYEIELRRGEKGPANRFVLDWPLPNVWLGVSVEDQKTADERIPLLLQTPAAVHFVSYEPALGPAHFSRWFCQNPSDPDHLHLASLNWVIVGGESGPGARPFDVAWARETVRQCREAGVAVFVKQLGAEPFDSEGRCNAHIAQIEDSKGGDPAEWAEDLRVREFPA